MADERVDRRAGAPLPEERVAGTDDPGAQAEAILADSDERTRDRDAAPGATVEHRTSEDVTDR
jgi:hypothetical protein